MRLAWLRQIKPASVLLACVFASLHVTAAQRATAEIPWRSELTSAHAEAKSQNKPILLHFYSDNCVWCDRLEAGAFQSPQLAAAVAQGFVPVKIHAGQSPELAKMFNVTKFPTDVVVTPAGKTLAHSVSPQDPNRYIAMLTQASSQMVESGSGNGPVGTPNPATQPDEMRTQMASAPVNAVPPQAMAPQSPDANPNMPVNTAGNFGMQQVPGNLSADGRQPSPNPHVAIPTGPMPGGATARLAGVRTDGMTLGMPGQLAGPASETAGPAVEMAGPAAQDASNETASGQATPKLAMEGYCAVTVIDEDQWVEGNPKFGVVHLGKLYLFSTAEKMETFLADPIPYTPVLNEIDVVRFFEERQIVPGKRRFGMRDPIHQRMFFFADEAAMNHFYNEYERYAAAAISVMERAVQDANPGSQ